MNKLLKNSLLLVLCQVGGMLIPLLELPILTRNLNPNEYGQLIYVISSSLIISIFIEFGFTFSASRKIAENHNKSKKIGRICSDVFLAKVGLSLISLFVLYLFIQSSSNISVPTIWILPIFVISLSMGFSPIWYFIGTEKLTIPAILDLLIRGIGLISLLLILPIYPTPITSLIIMATTGVINTLVPSLIMLREVEIQKLSIRGAFNATKESFNLFIFKSIGTLQQSIATLLLGRIGDAKLVGIFTPAEKLNRALIGLMTPIVNVFFPFFIKAKNNDENNFILIFKLFAIITFIVLSIVALITWFLAPHIINVVFGTDYVMSTHILQVLTLAIPFKGINIILNILWFVPLGKEHFVNKILSINIILLFPLAYFIIPIYELLGFVIGLVFIEMITTLLLIIGILRPVIPQKGNTI